MRRASLGMLFAAVLSLSVALPAAGQEGTDPSPEQLDAARALAEAGFQLYERGDHATALDRFLKAEEIYHAAPHVLFIGRSSEKLGKLVEAREAYEKLVGEELGPDAPEQFRTAQSDAQAELDALQDRIPSLTISLQGVEGLATTVTIDGKAVPPEALASPVEVNPGEHVVALTVPGRAPTQQTVELAEGATSSVELTPGPPVAEDDDGETSPPPIAADAEEPSIVPPLIVGGVGVALIGVGAITGVLTLNDAAELKDRCADTPCPVENQSLEDDVVTMSWVSTVGFIAGGAAVAGGVLWLVLQGSFDAEDEVATEPVVRVIVGGPFVGLEGTF